MKGSLLEYPLPHPITLRLTRVDDQAGKRAKGVEESEAEKEEGKAAGDLRKIKLQHR